LAITFETETLESQSNDQKNRITAWLPIKLESKNWFFRLGPRARWPWPKRPNLHHYPTL